MEVAEAALEGALTDARHRADASERRLLLSSGDELVAAVAAALNEFGFGVEDRDAIAEPGKRYEDLRLTDPDAPGWEAIVEVKGNKGGAKAGDLAALGRHATHYAVVEGRAPDAQWYVVSQNVGQDPGTRQPVFATNQEDLDGLADAPGLALDTSVLFLILMAVRRGDLDPANVRERLRTTRGRVEPPT
jgi:hypothetical protein